MDRASQPLSHFETPMCHTVPTACVLHLPSDPALRKTAQLPVALPELKMEALVFGGQKQHTAQIHFVCLSVVQVCSP